MTQRNQLTKGLKQRVMYVENKDGDIDGVAARIGWVTFSKTGKSVYYRGRTLAKANGVAALKLTAVIAATSHSILIDRRKVVLICFLD